ncbi:DUF397 domain-containing protein [Streptacidiphilus sp. EB129]|jgi:hypothetical protein|uniref:DUF397 domain-containing protein n=1 Tax=Streptacidiphilus sp. EB129 TaxID=3156262 RepID=UPI0035136106
MDQQLITDTDAPAWRKSSYSGNGQCVEIATPAVGVAVRDSKDPEGPTLSFSADAWSSFLTEIGQGSFDLT